MELRTAAAELGVHYQTAYRWVRDGMLPAAKVRGTYEVRSDDVLALRDRISAPRRPRQELHVRDWSIQAARLYSALTRGDEPAARAQLERLFHGDVDVLELCEQLLRPVLQAVGDGWAAGLLTVAEEHRASVICERALARYATAPSGRPRGLVVVATPEEERHALPAAMAAAVLRSRRWRVHHLGADVPTADLAALAREVHADAVVLSATTPGGIESAAAAADKLRAAGLTCHVGGPGARLTDLLSRLAPAA